MKKARRDFLKAAGAAAIGAGAYLSASRRGYAQTPPAFKWKAQCLWSPAETTYKAFEDLCKRIYAMTNADGLEITPFPSGIKDRPPTPSALEAVKNNVMPGRPPRLRSTISGGNPALAALGDLTMAWEHPWEADLYFHYAGGF